MLPAPPDYLRRTKEQNHYEKRIDKIFLVHSGSMPFLGGFVNLSIGLGHLFGNWRALRRALLIHGSNSTETQRRIDWTTISVIFPYSSPTNSVIVGIKFRPLA